MRLLFCFIPALIPAVLFGWGIHPYIGAFSFLCGFGVGWSITKVRPERGETK